MNSELDILITDLETIVKNKSNRFAGDNRPKALDIIDRIKQATQTREVIYTEIYSATQRPIVQSLAVITELTEKLKQL